MNNHLVEGHVRLSQYLGISVADVQGGGGNTSVKITPDTLLIKASGSFLKEITLEHPGVYVQYSSTLEYVTKNASEASIVTSELENEFNELIDSYTQLSNGKKASIETSLHALILKRYVAHTHSVYANVFTCASEGKALLEKILGMPIAWIEYAAPGLSLAMTLHAYLNKNGCSNVIFLKNHGIVVAADTCEELQLIYDGVVGKLRGYLRQRDALDFTHQSIVWKDADNAHVFVGEQLVTLFDKKRMLRHLFPDSVVFGDTVVLDDNSSNEIIYTNSGEFHFHGVPSRKVQVIYENVLAMNYILLAHQCLGVTTEYLSREDVSYILGMEREKYRKSLNK